VEGSAPSRETVWTRFADRVRQRPTWWRLAWLTLFVGVMNVVVLFAQLSALVHVLYLNADNASALVLAALASHAPAGSVVNLGNHPFYEPWWFMRATVGLPGYRQLWEGAPFLYAWLGIAAVTACAWWALGRLAALMCAVVLLSASEAQRAVLYVPPSHVLIVLHAGVLCGALIFVYRRARSGRLTRPLWVLIGAVLALFTGAGLTDQMLLVSGLAPFILAPLVCWLRLRSRASETVAVFALLTGVLSVAVELLVAHVMQGQHVVSAAYPIDFVASEALFSNLQNTIAALASLGGGSFFGVSASGANLLTLAAGALTFLALAAVLRALWHGMGPTEKPLEPLSLEAGTRELFIVYWGIVLVLGLAVFALTSLSNNAINYRYLLGSWVAVAALLGILSTTLAARAVLLMAVAVFGLLNIRSELANGVGKLGVGPNQRMAGAISHFVKAHGASIGYAGYWDAAPVTWETHLRVKVYPIEACSTPTGWCRFGSVQISSWYVPHPVTPTFLITDTRSEVSSAVSAPPASFGVPVAGEALGEGLSVYVYSHDIATDIGA